REEAVLRGAGDRGLAEGAADAAATAGRVDHEPGVGHVRALAGVVRVDLDGARDAAVELGDEGGAGRLLVHPERPGPLLGGVTRPRVGLAGGDDGLREGPDRGPVARFGVTNPHG